MAATEIRDSLRRGLFDGAAVDLYALTSELGGAPLDEDAYAEADPITDYPDGLSAMGFSAGVEWNFNEVPGTVLTVRSGDHGFQRYVQDDETAAFRDWHGPLTPEWGDWYSYAYLFDVAARLVEEDIYTEADAGTAFADNFTLMSSSGAGNFGPNAAEPGLLLNHSTGSGAVQTFTQYSNGNTYRRVYTASTWSSWVAYSMEGHAHAASAITYAGGTGMSATDVEAAIDELATEKANAGAAPTAHATSHQPGGSDAMAVDAVAATGSLRTLGTGAAQALPGNHSSTTDARTPTTREFETTFFFGSTLTTQVGVGKFKLPNSGTPTITEVTISVNTLPTGANVICDVNSVDNTTNAKTTLYATQGSRPTISTAGPYSNVATLPNTTQPGQGIEISVDIDQVGSSVAGSDLVVIVRGTY